VTDRLEIDVAVLACVGAKRFDARPAIDVLLELAVVAAASRCADTCVAFALALAIERFDCADVAIELVKCGTVIRLKFVELRRLTVAGVTRASLANDTGVGARAFGMPGFCPAPGLLTNWRGPRVSKRLMIVVEWLT
jgi:hypothetical protein